jgi:mono/diheme cytochrome c family protein
MNRFTARAVAITSIGLCGTLVVSAAFRIQPPPTPPRTITLTAVSAQGVWTEEPVTAGNAWRRDFLPARPVLRTGETVHIRLESPDVLHSFAIPELGIDPVEVYPGRTIWLTVTPERRGVFTYYCTVVCGERHFAMQGSLQVTDDGAPVEPPPALTRPGGDYWSTAPPGPGAGQAARGAELYRRSGCVTCHGEAGQGGVRNPNSMNATVPELATLARRTFLFSAADVAAFRAALDGRVPLGTAPPGLPLYHAVKTQYLATRHLVRDGRSSTKLHPGGARPPLDMPAWGTRLTDPEIDAILAYLMDLGGPDAQAAALSATSHTHSKGDVP